MEMGSGGAMQGGGAMMKGGMSCSCPHHKISPLLKAFGVLLFGLAFLMGNLGWISADTVATLWPLAIVLVGVAMFGRLCGCCKGMSHSCHG